MASASLRSGRCQARWSISTSTSRPSRKRISTSGWPRDRRTKARPRRDVEDLEAAVAQHEPDEHEDRRQRQERAAGDSRQQGAADEQRAEHGSAVSNEVMRVQSHTQNVAEGSTSSCGSPSWASLLLAGAGGACSGYLIEEHGTCLLLDCGNGVFSKLRNFCDYVDVDAVFISHLHADHILDVVPYASALTYAPRQQPVPVDRWPGTDTPARPDLYVPAAAADACAASARRRHARRASRRPSPCAIPRRWSSSRSARCGCASIASPTSCPPAPSTSPRPTAAGASPTAPTARRTRSSCASPTAPTCS